tara:strand:- start:5 stop:667 length:663 start_codon:yes stop_codon:yes gene_type:complete
MNKELKKRVVTSFLLLIFVILATFINKIIFAFAIFIVSIMCFHEWNNINTPYFVKKKKKGILLVRFIGLAYLFIFFVSSIGLHNKLGPAFFIFLLLVCASSDTGGYFFGKIIGGKKLTKISPNKTISGSIGSFIFSLIPLILFELQNIPGTNQLVQNILFCLMVSFFCQTGDLIISYFKRLNKIKDTGSILPGHGGLLDRIDGIIFAIPIVFILKVIGIF